MKVFGPDRADCDTCGIRAACHENPRRFVLAKRGTKYKPGGLMFVGEFASRLDVQAGEPFAGAAGRLLVALLEEVGIDPEECWFTNALLGQPPGIDKAAAKELPQSVYACLPRLEAEIAEAQPRVIVPMGQLALDAFTAVAHKRTRLRDNPCTNKECSPVDRKIGPVLVCATATCRHQVAVPIDVADAKQWAKDFITHLGGKCPQCEARWTRLQPKRVTCPECGGKKKLVSEWIEFRRDRVLTGRNGVVGAVFHTPEIPGALDELGVRFVIPTYAPQLLALPARDGATRVGFLTGGQFAARAALDHLAKAKALLTREPKFDVIVHSTEGAPPSVAAQRLLDYTAEQATYTVDSETNSHEGPWGVTRIVCVGVHKVGRDDALVVDTRTALAAGHPVVEAFATFLQDDSRKVFHNGSYDRMVILRMWGIDVLGAVDDTMYAHNAVYPDEEHGLGFVAHELTDAPAWKGGEAPKFEEFADLAGYRDFPSLALYNARDVLATGLVWQVLSGVGGGPGRMDIEKVRNAYDVDMDMQGLALEMEYAGMPLSRPVLDRIEAERGAVVDAKLAAMREIVGRSDFEPTGKALLWALYNNEGPLRLPVLSTTATGLPATDADTLRRYSSEPFVKLLIDYKAEIYNLSHYVRSDGLKLGVDGRLHPQWKVTGSRTGRWTSQPSMLNWPRWLRSAVETEDGRCIVGADQGQLEMRIMAALSGDETLIHICATANEADKLNPECDPHSYVARLVFGDSFTGLDRFDATHRKTAAGEAACACQKCQRGTLRDIVKRVVYGLNYGAGAATVLAAIYNGGYNGKPLDVPFIEYVTRTYFAAFPGVPKWRDRVWAETQKTREIRSPVFERRRIFPLGQVDASVVYNFPIQSGGADIMAIGLRKLIPLLPEVDPTARVIAQVHDAIYVECDSTRKQAVGEAIESSLSFELAFSAKAPPMKYIASAKSGPHWAAVS